HPSTLIKREYWFYPYPLRDVAESDLLLSLKNGSLVTTFGMVLVRQAPPTAKGMVFFTLEDEKGFINLVFTPHIYEKYRGIINRQNFLCAQGKLQLSEGGQSILVSRIFEMKLDKAEVISIKSTAKEGDGFSPSFNFQKARNYM
ncbi:MAG: hypothetical protein HQK54_02965, partial [Oligoflexales bacterium]|nr:hypothetical protein [Oligoflexales bacterium]